MSQVLATFVVEVTEEIVQEILDQVNSSRFDDDADDEEEFLKDPITLEQVKSNHKLLKYIVDEYKKGGDYDVFEICNADGFCEIDSYL